MKKEMLFELAHPIQFYGDLETVVPTCEFSERGRLRLKRLIVRNGNKIFPLMVENTILSLPEIEGCAVVGLHDGVEKTVPVAHIVLKDDVNIDYKDIVKKIEMVILSKMPNYCLPVRYVFRRNLPLTGMVKIDFKTLEDESKQYRWTSTVYISEK